MVLLGIQADAECTLPPEMEVCGLPNISTRLVAANWDFFADFFVWYASEETSSSWANVITTKITHTGIFDTFKAEPAPFDWDFGFRIGGGYNFEYDQWDSQLYWTWFRTQADENIPSADHSILPEFYGSFINGDIAQSAKLKWHLHYNMFDWELGRSYWVSKGLSLRPFIGVKGGWINQSIDSNWQVKTQLSPTFPFPITVDYSSTENLKNNFWGAGPSGGINTKWNLGNSCARFVSLFGDFSAATMWGTWHCKDVYNNSTPKEYSVNMKNANLGALMLRGFLGIGWDADFNRGCGHFSTRVGYEMQIWFNQLRLPTFQLLRLHGDLTFQGGTFNFRFDY